MDISEEQLESALHCAATNYFAQCRQRIPDFIQTHFQYPGCWHTNKRALGLDLIRAPINLFWAPFYLSLQLLGALCCRFKLEAIGKILNKTPSGLTTDIQRYLTALTYSELLGRSHDDANDNLYQHIRAVFDNDTEFELHLSGEHSEAINHIIHDALEQYRITRTAAADIGNSLFSTLLGGFAFQKFTPGGFAVGLALAVWLSHQWAVDSFILGQWAGNIVYSLFPPTPSFSLSLFSVCGVMACLAIIASFSGLITDPIQTLTGLHKNRLEKMIQQLELDFKQNKAGGFRPKDQFVARILEVIDAAKANLL